MKKQREGLDEEIRALRELIKDAIGRKDEFMTLSDRTKLISTISRAMDSLARSLQVKNELNLAEGDPGVMLRKALKELEEEWPEFKKLVSKYYPNKKEEQNK